MAGDAPGFEEAARALFAGNQLCFEELIAPWPADVRDHAKKLASVGFEVLTGGVGQPESRLVRVKENRDRK